MNFFKSVFSDDPHPPQSESPPHNAHQNNDSPRDSSPIEQGSASNSNPNASAWNFGGLIKNLTVKSESILETYRRDLQEFSSGLKKEIEVAHGSLETVGHAFDEFGNSLVKGTAQIISQGKDAILALESDSDNNNNNAVNSYQKLSGDKSFNSRAYSRFDAQVRAIQCDVSTYCEEPEDLSDYNKWKLGFSLEGKEEEFEGYFRENGDMEGIYGRVVPSSVDHETFWFRYCYKVYRLKKAEELRARLVRRASVDEEDLSWDFEDEDGDKGYEAKASPKVGGEVMEKSVDTKLPAGSSSTGNEVTADVSSEEHEHQALEESTVEKRDNLLHDKGTDSKEDKSVVESKVEKEEVVHEVDDGSNIDVIEAGGESTAEVHSAVKNDSPRESDSKLVEERKADDAKPSIEVNDNSALEEEDLGWDEIEDLSSIDEKRPIQSSSSNKVDLRKRLSVAKEDEDLSVVSTFLKIPLQYKLVMHGSLSLIIG